MKLLVQLQMESFSYRLVKVNSRYATSFKRTEGKFILILIVTAKCIWPFLDVGPVKSIKDQGKNSTFEITSLKQTYSREAWFFWLRKYEQGTIDIYLLNKEL